MNKFSAENYEKCVPDEDATRIEINWTTLEAKLVYNHTAFKNATCCYSEILRSGQGRTADDEFRYVLNRTIQFQKMKIHSDCRLTSCKKFDKTIVLPPTVEFIFVKCESGRQTVYKNTHTIIRDKPEVRRRLIEFKKKPKMHRPLSVLMLSIDSVSRLNFMRSMPLTHKTLIDNNWFELQGYNKVKNEGIFLEYVSQLFDKLIYTRSHTHT